MNDKPPPNKPPEKRGVNKATMDLPQEEFIDDQSASATKSSSSPEPSKATSGDAAKNGKKSERL
jgi:hypothetical protein